MSIKVIQVKDRENVCASVDPVVLCIPQGVQGGGGGIDPSEWLNNLPEYQTDDDANGDLNIGEFYWLAPPPDVGQNRTLKQRT